MSGLALQVEYIEAHVDLIVGDAPHQGDVVTLQDPWRNVADTIAGEKDGWGDAGFEFLAPNPAPGYMIRLSSVDGSQWVFEHKRGITKLSWAEVGPRPEPEPEPEPEPPPDPDPERIEVLPGRIYSGFIRGDVVRYYPGKIEGAHHYHVGHYLPGTTQYLPTTGNAKAALKSWVRDLDERLMQLKRAIIALEV